MDFSIFIPAYKRKYLEKAISSCLNQTYKDFEIVILNDASPENLQSIVSKFTDRRILYYENDSNVGALNVVDNWNKCLELCSGDYIICMGDDDCLAPNCLQSYKNIMNKYPSLGVYHTRTIVIDENDKQINIQQSRPEYESALSLAWHRWNGRTIQFIGDFCFSKNSLREHQGFFKLPLAWASDDISAIISAKEHGIANTSEVGFYYRVSSQTITNSSKAETKVDAIRKEKEWYNGFLSILPSNNEDALYRELMLSEIDNHFKIKIRRTISEDLHSSHNILKICKWWKKRQMYNLKLNDFVFILFKALRA